MKIRPLIIDENSREIISRLIKNAEENEVHMKDVVRMMGNESLAVGYQENFRGVIPVGYRVVFSIEHQPCGRCRHLSVSVDRDGYAPSQEAVTMIAQEFGFKGGLLEMDHVWQEPIEGDDGENKVAINVIQKI